MLGKAALRLRRFKPVLSECLLLLQDLPTIGLLLLRLGLPFGDQGLVDCLGNCCDWLLNIVSPPASVSKVINPQDFRHGVRRPIEIVAHRLPHRTTDLVGTPVRRIHARSVVRTNVIVFLGLLGRVLPWHFLILSRLNLLGLLIHPADVSSQVCLGFSLVALSSPGL